MNVKGYFKKVLTEERHSRNIQNMFFSLTNLYTYLLLNWYFTVGPKIFCQIIGIPMRSDPAPFLPIYSYISMKVKG